MNDRIGIFDSGVGGISVLSKAVELLPHESFIYYGDNKNAPYGTKTIEEICALSAAVVDELMGADVKALVIACNTITSAYAEILRRDCPIPVIGMEPAVKPASFARKGGAILALATRATLSLEKFARLMNLYGEGVIPIEGKGFVELVENEADEDCIRKVLLETFAPYLNTQVDGIVLGCTHYPFLRRYIEELFPSVPIFDGREGTVRQLERRLREMGSLTDNTGSGSVEFRTSGDERTLELMRRLFEKGI